MSSDKRVAILEEWNIPLKTAEVVLRRDLGREDAPPFIAHLELKLDLVERVRAAVAEVTRGRISHFLTLMSHQPAICVWLMTRGLAENYRVSGTSSIYGPIAKAIGHEGEIHQPAHAGLNAAFRRACRRLGLSLSARRPETSSFVDDYVLQAGVAQAQLPDLAAAFLSQEASRGPAPDHDTNLIKDWELGASHFVPEGLTRLRKILEHDDTGYHVTVFARLRRGEAVNGAFAEVFNSAITTAEAQQSRERRPGSRRVPPDLIYLDSGLAVVAPPGSAGHVVRLGERDVRLLRGGSMAIIPPWPDRVHWRHADESASASFELQIMPKSSDLIVFDAESGRWLTLVSSLSTGPGTIPGGDIVVAARVPFTLAAAEAFEVGPGCFMLYARTSGATMLEIEGHRRELVPWSRPRIEIEGERIARNGGSWLIASPETVTIFHECAENADELDLVLDHPALGERVRVRPEFKAEGMMSASIAEVIPRSGLFGPLRLFLTLHGQERPMVRGRCWVWPGLERFRDRAVFEAPELPENFDRDASRHLAFDDAGYLMLPPDGEYLRACIAFRLENGQLIPFELPRPGVGLSIRTPDGRARPIKIGTTLTIGDELASLLVIGCPGSTDGLDIRGTVEREPFGRLGERRIPFAALASGGAHDRICLLRSGRVDDSMLLVRIAPAADPVSFEVRQDVAGARVTARFHRLVDAVRVEVENLVSGALAEAEYALGRRPVSSRPDDLLRVSMVNDEQDYLRVEIDAKVLDYGVWITRLFVREDGREEWMPVINARGDVHALGLTSGLPPSAADVLDRPDAGLVFRRLTRALSECYADPCWPGISCSAEALWLVVGKGMGKRLDGRRTLLEACGIAPPADASASWIPLHHPIELASDLFAAPAAQFAVLDGAEVDGMEQLGMLAAAAGCEMVRDARDRLQVGAAFFAAFENPVEAERDASIGLRGFDFARYLTIAESLESDPEGGLWTTSKETLTLAHHSSCCARMVERIWTVAPEDSRLNRGRLPLAMRVARAASSVGWADALEAPESLRTELALMETAPSFFSTVARHGRQGEIEPFWDELQRKTGLDLPRMLRMVGFLIRLGPELFAFYLMLWELVEMSRKP